MRKILGIISDFDENPDNINVNGSFYRVRKNYIDSLINYSNPDALIIIIPYIFECIDDYVDLCDGLLCVGSLYDVDPTLYGREIIFKNVKLCNKRFKFEVPFISKFLKTGKSFFGICAGMQSLNVALGGTLYQDIPSEINNCLLHFQSDEYSKSSHNIDILESSKLFGITNKKNISVNSMHHQAIQDLGRDLIVSARSSDGVVEAVEKEDYKFCIGVQWHPEHHSSVFDINIFKAFLNSL